MSEENKCKLKNYMKILIGVILGIIAGGLSVVATKEYIPLNYGFIIFLGFNSLLFLIIQGILSFVNYHDLKSQKNDDSKSQKNDDDCNSHNLFWIQIGSLIGHIVTLIVLSIYYLKYRQHGSSQGTSQLDESVEPPSVEPPSVGKRIVSVGGRKRRNK